jgi:porphobilinogen synthase
MRRLTAGVKLSSSNFVYPLFVCPGEGVKEPIGSMEGCFHLSPDLVAEEAREIAGLGIPAVLLFGLPKKKDARGTEGWAEDSAVCRAVRAIKRDVPGMVVITDVCLCAYTDHGHCGIVSNGRIDNDQTLQLLARMALAHGKAGGDAVAPSDMMDGRVKMIRQTLDGADLQDTAIMSYSAKYASAFYGPFRDAACSAPAFGDRKTYQMDPAANPGQAMREIELDIEEGADIVMVKPAMPYLDVIRSARQRFDVPLAAYQVSGEYMMICRAASAGLLDRQNAMLESLTAIKRAGADILITYFAKEAAAVLNE